MLLVPSGRHLRAASDNNIMVAVDKDTDKKNLFDTLYATRFFVFSQCIRYRCIKRNKMAVNFVTVAVFSILSVCLYCGFVDGVNVTIVVYGMWMPPLLQSLIYTAAGFDLGARDAVRMFGDNMTMTVDYTASKDVLQCPDISASYYRVAERYYRLQQDRDQVLGIFYAGCDSAAALADFGREWNIFALSSGTTFSNLRDRTVYPTTIAFGPMQYELYGLVIGRFLQAYNWTSAALIYDISGFTVYNLRVAEEILRYFRTYYGHMEMHAFPVNTSDVMDFPKIIRELSSFTRVIFLSLPPNSAKIFLKNFAASGEPAEEYVRIYIDIPGAATSPLALKYTDKKNEEARQLFSPLLFLTICYDHAERDVADLKNQMKDLAVHRYNATFRPGSGPSELVMTAYTSMLLYAQVVQETVQNGNDPRDGTLIAQAMQNRTFSFPEVGSVYIDQYGERKNILCFFAFQAHIQTFEKVVYFDGATGAFKRVHDLTINWSSPNNMPPPNKPLCGYQRDLPPCRKEGLSGSTIIGMVIGILIMTAVVVISLLRRMRQMPVSDEWWKIDTDCLNNASHFLSTKNRSAEPRAVTVYKGTPVWSQSIPVGQRTTLLQSSTGEIHVTTAFKRTMMELRVLKERCRNINPLIGIDLRFHRITYFYGFCSRGSLIDLFQEINLDWSLKSSLIADLVEGVAAIHRSRLGSHGHLCPATCLVDKHLVLKIGDVGLNNILLDLQLDAYSEETISAKNWIAPELRDRFHEKLDPVDPTADIYSVGELISYIALDHVTDHQSILTHDQSEVADIPSKARTILSSVIEQCEHSDRTRRPTIYQIMKNIGRAVDQSGRLVDKLLKRLENYAAQLESAVFIRTQTLKMEIEKCDILLGEVLPRCIIVQLRIGRIVQAEEFHSATLLFTAVSGFDELVRVCHETPLDIVNFLGHMFSLFDRVIGKYDCYKVETIIDTYLVASGVPVPNNGDHVFIIGKLSLNLRSAFLNHFPTKQLNIQCGVHTGPCAAGIVGTARPRYCLFGDSVNVTSRLVSSSQPGRIHVSAATAKAMEADETIRIYERGKIWLKGLGEVSTYWLEG